MSEKHERAKLRIVNDGSMVTQIFLDDKQIDSIVSFKLSQKAGTVPVIEITRIATKIDIEIDGIDVEIKTVKPNDKDV